MTTDQIETPDFARAELLSEATRLPAVAEAMRVFLAAAPRVPLMRAQPAVVSFSTSTTVLR